MFFKILFEILLKGFVTPRVGVWVNSTCELTFPDEREFILIIVTQVLHQSLLLRVPFLVDGEANGFITFADSDWKEGTFRIFAPFVCVLMIKQLITAGNIVDNGDGHALGHSLCCRWSIKHVQTDVSKQGEASKAMMQSA